MGEGELKNNFNAHKKNIKYNSAHKLRATKNYHKVEVWEKGQKENSHEKVSQSLFFCTRRHTYTQADTYPTHMDTKFLLYTLISLSWAS